MSERITNYQTRILGAKGICDTHLLGAGDQQMLEQALNRIPYFIGITERFADSCRCFDKKFGTNISRNIRRENVLRPQGVELGELITRIEPLIELDRVLYEAAVTRLNADLQITEMQ